MKWAPRAPLSNAVCGSEIEEEPTEIQASKHARSIRHRASDGRTWRVCSVMGLREASDGVPGTRYGQSRRGATFHRASDASDAFSYHNGVFVSQVAFAAAAIV